MGLVFGPLGLLFVLMSGSKKPAASPAAATEVPSFEVRVEVDHSHGRRREPDLSLSRPAPEGSYRGLNDWKDSLTTVWSGARPPIEFTYVYPVGSSFAAGYEHPEGIVLSREDAEKLGIEIE